MITLCFFNNKGGIGRTSLVAHVAWMFADRGIPVLAVDLDPQGSLSSLLLNDERRQELWTDQKTILASLKTLDDPAGDTSAGTTQPDYKKLRRLNKARSRK